MDEEQPHLTKTEARAGSTPGVVRIVLLLSLVLGVIALAAVLLLNQR